MPYAYAVLFRSHDDVKRHGDDVPMERMEFRTDVYGADDALATARENARSLSVFCETRVVPVERARNFLKESS